MGKIVAGRFARLFGSHGEVTASLYDVFPVKPDVNTPLWVKLDGLDVPVYMESFARRGKTSALVRLADIDSVARAEIILGKEFHIESDDDGAMDPEGLESIVGYKAHLDGGVSGVVTGLAGSESNPLLRIESRGREIWIPVADELIARIDDQGGEIWFDLPEGLLTLND